MARSRMAPSRLRSLLSRDELDLRIDPEGRIVVGDGDEQGARAPQALAAADNAPAVIERPRQVWD